MNTNQNGAVRTEAGWLLHPIDKAKREQEHIDEANRCQVIMAQLERLMLQMEGDPRCDLFVSSLRAMRSIFFIHWEHHLRTIQELRKEGDHDFLS